MIDHVHALPEGYALQEYVVTALLGFGGFGITYAARDTNLDMDVAIKEYLPSELAVRLEGSTVSAKSQQDKDSFQWGLDRFIDEGRAVARFNHPNIIRIHRFFEQNGTGYIVMELLEGQTLADELAEQGTLHENRIRSWIWPVLDGLRVVHSAGYIHRDIKPQNIMMTRDGVPVLLDFGAARLAVGGRTRSMTSIMTPGFAPLEQYQTRGQGPWTDIYALGAVLYKCMTGRKPQDALDRVTSDQLESPGGILEQRYSHGLRDGVMAALAVAPTDRPQSIDDWVAILDGGEPSTIAGRGAHEDGATRIMPPAGKTAAGAPDEAGHSKRTAAGPGKWAIAALVLLALGAGVYWWKYGPATGGEPGSPVTEAVDPAGAVPRDPVREPPAGDVDPTVSGSAVSPASQRMQSPADSISGESVTESAPAAAFADGESVEADPLSTVAPDGISPDPAVPFRDCDACPEMVAVPPGEFRMGSPATEPGRAPDEPERHTVVIGQPFAIGRYEVTVAEFMIYARETNPSSTAELAALPGPQPVTGVSWDEAVAYADWLSARTGRRYRLPTEAEWEYAARAGSDSAYWWGGEMAPDRAHCRGCGSSHDQQGPAAVGTFDASPFGLYDVHGNVSEWVQDCSNRSATCSRRVLKGGSYVDQPAGVRAAWRYVLSPRQSRNYLGFRVARDM